MDLSTLKFTDQSNGEVDGKKFEFAVGTYCTTCIFQNDILSDNCCLDYNEIQCTHNSRKDKLNGNFKFTEP